MRAGGEELPAGAWERDEGIVAWIYGSILAGAAVVVAANVIASQPGQVAAYTAATMLVVWVVHSYAAFVGHGGRLDVGGLRARFVHALGTELPVLVSATPTVAAATACAVLGAGVSLTGLVGLITAIATMAVVAAVAARRAHAGPLGITAATSSALVVGALLVAAKVVLK